MEILHETQAFSPLDVFALYTKAEKIRIEAYENYQKRSLRNKYIIQTANGLHALTIPLKSGKNRQMPIKAVEISYDEDWPKHHLHAIQSAYGKSPFFTYYQESLESLFLSNAVYLYDFNMAALRWALGVIGIRMVIEETASYEKNDITGTTRYRDYAWPSPEVREANPCPYVQVWSPSGMFCYHISILDAIFCAGPSTLSVLKEAIRADL